MESRWEQIAKKLPYTEDDIEEAPIDQEALSKWEKKAGKAPTKQPGSDFKFEQDKPIRQGISNVYRPLLELGGLTAGGLIGGAAGPFFGVVGAAGGHAIGAGGADIFDEITGLRKAPSVKEAMIRSGEKAIEGATIDMGGKVVEGVVTKALSPMQRRFTQNARVAQQESESVGLTLTAGETTGSSTQQLFESLADKVPFAATTTRDWRLKNQLEPLIKARKKILKSNGDPINADALGLKIKETIDDYIAGFDNKTKEGVEALRNAVLSKMGSKESYESLGIAAQDALAKRSIAAVAKKNSVYAEIADSMPKGELKFNAFTDETKNITKKIKQLPNQDSKLRNILKIGEEQTPEIKSLIKELEQYPPQVRESIAKDMGVDLSGPAPQTWETMQALRSQLSELIKGEDLSVKMNAPHLKGQMSINGRFYSKIKGALDKDFQRLAEEKGSDAFKKLQIANAFYTNEFAPIWKTKTIQRMAYTNPEKVVEVAFKPNGVTEVNLAKQALGEKGFIPLQKSFTNKLFGADKAEPFSPDKLAKKLNSYGNEMLSAVYKPNELKVLWDVATTGKLVLEKKLPSRSFLASIANHTPNAIVDSIIGTAEKLPNSKVVLENITRLQPVLKKGQWEGLRHAFGERLFKINPTTETIAPVTLNKSIQTYKKILPKFYSQEEISFIEKIGRGSQRMASAEKVASNPSGTAQNVIAYGVGSAILIAPVTELLSGNIGKAVSTGVSGVAGLVFMPRQLAKLMLSKTGRKYFSEGLLRKASTKKGIELGAKILAIATKGEEKQDTQMATGHARTPIKPFSRK